ncbi:uncharacterized protein PAE49_010034 [Odontesthes bonariensis]
MAANGYLPIPITFLHTCENSFYFQEVENLPDLEEDFSESLPSLSSTFWIQSKDQKFLIMTEENFQVYNLDVPERKQPECKFNIQVCTDDSREVRRPVMLYANEDNQKMAVCCRNETEVYPECMELPERTPHKALFYPKYISSDKFTFESTVYRKRFLAFQQDGGFPCGMKLCLCPKADDVVDERCEITVSQVPKT